MYMKMLLKTLFLALVLVLIVSPFSTIAQSISNHRARHSLDRPIDRYRRSLIKRGGCTSGFSGTTNGNGPCGACCTSNDDCQESCDGGSCTDSNGNTCASGSSSSSSNPPPSTSHSGQCLSGYLGTKSGNGPCGGCCSSDDDCQESCLNGSCTNSDGDGCVANNPGGDGTPPPSYSPNYNNYTFTGTYYFVGSHTITNSQIKPGAALHFSSDGNTPSTSNIHGNTVGGATFHVNGPATTVNIFNNAGTGNPITINANGPGNVIINNIQVVINGDITTTNGNTILASIFGHNANVDVTYTINGATVTRGEGPIRGGGGPGPCGERESGDEGLPEDCD